MVHPLVIGAGIYLLAEAYKRYVPKQTKAKWENKVKMHHGEAGVLMTAGGLLTKSPNLTASGISLMLHDRDDAKKWFTGDKSRKGYYL